jgi:hypothetical protein
MAYLLCSDHIGRLGTFGALDDVEIDFVSFLQGFESFLLYSREVNEDILTAILLFNKAESLGIIEPFYLACCQTFSPPFTNLSFDMILSSRVRFNQRVGDWNFLFQSL